MTNLRRTLIVDGAIAAALWIASVAALALFKGMSDGMLLVYGLSLFSALLIAPLIIRRTHTVASASWSVAIFFIQFAFSIALIPANIAIIFIVYALACYASRLASLAGLAIAYLGTISAFLTYETILFVSEISLTSRIMLCLLALALITSAWLLGNVRRSRRALFTELTNRAHRLEKEQKQEIALSTADERARIAREMHDIIAHSLSVIITQADGASYAAKTNPVIAQETLGTISNTARDSLTEMRRLLGILRQDESFEMGPAPSITSIRTLVNEIRQIGVKIKFDEQSIEGSQHRLPPGAELAAYRVVQEALTNVVKHAGPVVSVEVKLDWQSDGLMVAVVDDGRGSGANPPAVGSGQGIRGMNERMSLYGGTVVAQPKIGGGFAVHAWIPYS